jgi:hypothetical protein
LQFLSYICMGGVFLFKKIFQLGCGFLCGYLFIKWVPFSFQLSFEEVLANFVLKPLKFFGAAVILMVGTILNGELIKIIVKGDRKNNLSIRSLVICIGLFISFFTLSKIGIWQSLLLLCFSVLYGMFSLIKKQLEVNTISDKRE